MGGKPSKGSDVALNENAAVNASAGENGSSNYGSIADNPSDSADQQPSSPPAAPADDKDEAEKAASKPSKKSTSQEQLIEKDGEPHAYDPEFHGPIKNRSCTDVLCFITFTLFVIGWIAVGIFAFVYGDPEQLMFPTDSFGRKCGFDPGVQDRPYLHFFDISQCANPIVLIAGCPTPQICVKECPQTNFFAAPFGHKEDLCVSAIREKFACRPGVDPLEEGTGPGGFGRTCADLLRQDCAPYTVASAPILDRCVPTLGMDQAINGTLVDSNNQTMGDLSMDNFLKACENLGAVLKIKGLGESIGRDFQSSWWVIVSALVICMCVSLLWILLMRWFTSIMVWTALFGALAAITYGCVYTYLRYDSLCEAEEANSGSQYSSDISTVQAFNSQAGSLLAQKDTWLAFFICLCVLGGILLLLIIVLFKRLRIAIEVIEEASKAVTSILTSLAFPIVPWLLQLLVVLSFATLALHIVSMGTKQYRVTALGDNCTMPGCQQFQVNGTCEPDRFNGTCRSQCPEAECTFIGYRKFDSIPYLHFYNLFALLWLMFFVSAMGEMILAGAFAGWYWTFDKSKNLPALPIVSSAGRTLRYHIGTLAFGSLIIAIIRLIRLILDYIDKKCRKYGDNPIVKAIICCCKCCMWCLEKFMKFINRNAYIMCAIYGKNFCTSAKDGFNLIMRNILRVLAVNSVCDFLLFLGKVLITAGVTVGSFYFLDNRIPIKGLDTVVPQTENTWVPTLTIAAGCYFITSLFFSVYEMAVDTIFLCFLEDIERNDGSPEKPYFMSKDLMKLIGKKNKPPTPKKE